MRRDDSGCFLGAYVFVRFFSWLKRLLSKGRTWRVIGIVFGIYFIISAFTDKFLPSPFLTFLLGLGLIILSLLPIIRNWWSNWDASKEVGKSEEEFSSFRFDDIEDEEGNLYSVGNAGDKKVARGSDTDSSYSIVTGRDIAEWKRQDKIEQKEANFADELAAIPRVEVRVGEPVADRKKAIPPERHFSNVTRSTNLSKLFPFVVVDVESTGLSPVKDEIVEISAIRYEEGFRPVSAFTTYTSTRKGISLAASEKNWITDDMIEDYPRFSEVAASFSEFIAGCNIVGHSLIFDLEFLFVHGADIPDNVRFYDTVMLARYAINDNDIYDRKLTTLCEYYHIHRANDHAPLSDCLAIGKIFENLIEDKTA